MDTLPLCILIITGSVATSAEIAVQGIEGETLLINWTYPRGYESYAKYFVRGEYSTATLDKLVESNEAKADQKVTKGKYSLYDYKSAALLTAAITKLSLDDTGTYHFGIKEFGRDTHMNVRVSVIKAPTTVAPLSTLTTFTDTEGQLHTTSPIDGRPETALITLTTRDANNATSTDEGPETELTASTTRHANKAASSDELPETELTASSTRHANKAASSDNPVIKIAVSAIALVLVLLLIIGMYYAKMKNKKAVSSTGQRTETIRNTHNGAAQVSEQNIDMAPYSDINFAEINNPIYGNSEEAINYSTHKCRKKEQRPSITYATVKCDKEEHRLSITYTAVDFVDCGKKPNVLASASKAPSLYSTVNC